MVEKNSYSWKTRDLHARRQVENYLFDSAAAKKVFTDYASRFGSRPGGYTRILKLGSRFGDGAQMCHLELVDFRDNEAKDSND
ncbi:MAG: bL17 family ribosomal protein [Bdellovibrionota bacterium]